MPERSKGSDSSSDGENRASSNLALCKKKARMPERSKGADLSSAGESLVGSNPTLCKPRFFTKKFLCGLMVMILGFHPRVRGSIPRRENQNNHLVICFFRNEQQNRIIYI